MIAAAGHKDLTATEARDIGEKLFISPKTADHHIQNAYTKIAVSTRAAAALWAMQNEVVS